MLHHGDPTGPSFSLSNEIAWLASGGSVEVIAPWRSHIALPTPATAKLTELPFRPLIYPPDARTALTTAHDLLSDVRRIRQYLRRAQPDLVLIVTGTLPAASLAAYLEGIPTIVYLAEIFGRDSPRGWLRLIGGRAVGMATAALADRCICCSDAVAGQLPPRIRSRATTIYPAIDISPAGRAEGESFRQRHGVPLDAICLMLVGNISYGRGHDLLLAALAQLRREVPNIACAFVGAPHPRQPDFAFARDVKALASRLGLDDRVHWCGFVENIAHAYAAADIVVNPARMPEAFGRVALEALIAGCPVVTTGLGAVREVLTNEKEALIVEPVVPSALEEAIKRLTSDQQLANELVERGRRHIRERFDPHMSLSRFSELVAEALA